jgi:LmbE family N-acetylglucosaminyl deacetylase
MPQPSRKIDLRKVVAATATALVPFGGPILRRHFDNFDALETQFPIMAPLGGRERIFVLAPHPDDECLGAGGLISRARTMGIEVQIGFLSNGDGSRTTQISQVLRGKDEKTLPEIARKRQDEAVRAAQILGVHEEKRAVFWLSRRRRACSVGWRLFSVCALCFALHRICERRIRARLRASLALLPRRVAGKPCSGF